jgi:hypothetical protein
MVVLESAHRADWLGPAGGDVFRAEFRRGFVEHAVLPAALFLRAGAELRRRHPLRGVALLGARLALAELLDGPHLRGLAALHLTGGRLGDDGVRRLAAAPALAGLRVLRLGRNDLGDAAAAALAHSRPLASLIALALDDNAVGDAGAQELARSLHLARLTTLSLAANEIGPAGVAALRASPRLAGLTRLDVADQRVPSGRWLLLPAAK